MGVGIGGYMTTASFSSNDAVGTGQENGNQTVKEKWMSMELVCSPQEMTS